MSPEAFDEREDEMKDEPFEPHQCIHCKKIFKSAQALEDHDTKIHAKEKPFKCEHCSMAYYSSHSLDHDEKE